MQPQLTLVVGGAPGVATALERAGRFAKVLHIDTAGGMRTLLQQGVLSGNRDSVIFLLADTLPAEGPMTVDVMLAKLTPNGFKVIVLEQSPKAHDLVRQYPGAGLLSGDLTVNIILASMAGLGFPLPPTNDGGVPIDPTGQSAPVVTQAEPASWGTPIEAPTADWGAPVTPAPAADWGAPAAPVAAPVDAWGAPAAADPAPAPAASGWDAPVAPATAAADAGWAATPEPTATTGGWDAPAPAPAAPAAEPAADAWGASAPETSNGWGPTAANDSWGAAAATPAAPEPAQDSWGSTGSDSWQAAPAAPAATDSWGAPAAPAAPASGWDAPAGNDGWGAPAPAPVAATDQWGAPAPAAPADQWGAPTQQPAFGELATRADASPAQPARRGHVITVTAPKGGVGKSGLTLNLACYLGLRLAQQGKRVTVIDTDFQKSDTGKYLGEYSPTVVQALRDAGAISPERIDNYLVHKPAFNLSVLLGPSTPAEANPLYINGRLYRDVLDAMKTQYDYILIDTPVAEVHHDIFREFALPCADYLVVAVAPNFATLMDTDQWLRAVTAPTHTGGSGVDPNKLGYVINRAEEGIACEPEEITRELYQWRNIGIIPETKAWKLANNRNQLVATMNYSDLNAAFAEILYNATGEEALRYDVPATVEPVKKNLLGGLVGKILGGKK